MRERPAGPASQNIKRSTISSNPGYLAPGSLNPLPCILVAAEWGL